MIRAVFEGAALKVLVPRHTLSELIVNVVMRVFVVQGIKID